MKTKIILSAILISVACANAQENSGKIKLPGFGVGVHIEQFRLGDVLNNNLPVNSFIFTGNINNVFRIEPEIGFYSSTDNADIPGEPEITASSTRLALGLYYMFQKENVNFSIGALLESITLSEDNYNGFTNTEYTIETNTFGFGPALSAEYFFGKHFSFGASLSLQFASRKQESSLSTSESKSHSLQTITGLAARFYF